MSLNEAEFSDPSTSFCFASVFSRHLSGDYKYEHLLVLLSRPPIQRNRVCPPNTGWSRKIWQFDIVSYHVLGSKKFVISFKGAAGAGKTELMTERDGCRIPVREAHQTRNSIVTVCRSIKDNAKSLKSANPHKRCSPLNLGKIATPATALVAANAFSRPGLFSIR